MGARGAGADTRCTMRHRPSPRLRNARPTPGRASQAPGLELCPACADPIARAVRKLDLERMAATVESLIVALQRDLIGPADFAR
jgi:hypothetical protein